MRIALISDLHGNALATEKVITDARRRGSEIIVCLGDVATLGPKPRETLALLASSQIVTLLGNHDDFLLRPETIQTYTDIPFIRDAIHWCRDQLSGQELSFVTSFIPTLELDVDDKTRVSLFHGSPRSHTEDILATTPEDTFREALLPFDAQVYAGGHTHIPMIRRLDRKLVVNPGSVGLPFERFAFHGPPSILDRAEYAIVDAGRGLASVEAIQVELSRSDLREQATSIQWPMAKMLSSQYA